MSTCRKFERPSSPLHAYIFTHHKPTQIGAQSPLCCVDESGTQPADETIFNDFDDFSIPRKTGIGVYDASC